MITIVQPPIVIAAKYNLMGYYNTLKSLPVTLLPAITNVFYTIVGATLDYDNIDIDSTGSKNWQIVNLTAFGLAGGNANIAQFGWTADTKGQIGIIQSTVGIFGGSYLSTLRSDSIVLYSNADDNLADFNYCNLILHYIKNYV